MTYQRTMNRRTGSGGAAWAVVLFVGVCAGGRAEAQCEPEETAKLFASDAAEGEQFGFSAAIDGAVAVIGAMRDGENGEHAGAAYVFRYDGAVWREEAKLLASDGSPGDEFGIDVAVSGDVIAVATRGAGAAYVFRSDGTGWIEEQKFGPRGGSFGYNVGVHGDTLVVGRLFDSERGPGAGAAHVFEHDGDEWRERQKLLASDSTGHEQFGYKVEVRDDLIAIGAHHDQDHGTQSGSAYLFRRGRAQWDEEAKLLASDGGGNDTFGKALAIDDGIVLVGSNARNGDGVRTGAAYVYRQVGPATWQEVAKLTPSDGEALDWFGLSVAVHGRIALVGASGNDENGNSAGALYVFRLDGRHWAEVLKLQPSDGSAGSRFGYSAGLAGWTAVVGARTENENGDDAGAAYVFDLNCPSDCPADIDDDGLVGRDDLIAVLAAWGNKGGREDLDGNGVVDFGDLLILLAAWGPCE